ncbi:putative LRR receptor-like protein kinase [Trifolium pratense]|uniref:non-specific serine/threonine protein kinase n=1 Tax=Trifolium pratense TaxID=57577 RepID=A0A2K3LB55_TRIPR|nr:putative LRR receptor-like protein kinase [Trifolium pratense]
MGKLVLCLYDDVEAMEFNWRKRVNIVKGVVSALSYLHHDYTAPLVHRDVSSSNLLLNSEWQPSVSHFGTARLGQQEGAARGIIHIGSKNNSTSNCYYCATVLQCNGNVDRA